jgi:hypothetical protein
MVKSPGVKFEFGPIRIVVAGFGGPQTLAIAIVKFEPDVANSVL